LLSLYFKHERIRKSTSTDKFAYVSDVDGLILYHSPMNDIYVTSDEVINLNMREVVVMKNHESDVEN